MYQTIQTKIMTVKEPSDNIAKTPENVRDLCSDLVELSQESFHILTLNTRNAVIDRHMIALGLTNACLVHPREVFRAAISDAASGVILIHNHPSGNVAPSIEDIKITRQLIEAGHIIDIPILDHIILGRHKDQTVFQSLREDGICQFKV